MRVAPQLYDLDPRDILRRDIPFYTHEIDASRPVLDVGVGTGRLAIALASEGFCVTGIDKDPSMLSQAIYNLWRQPVIVQSRVSLCLGSIEDYRSDIRFGAIVFGFRTFAAIIDPEKQHSVLELCSRLIDSNGKIFITLPLELNDPVNSWVGTITHDWKIGDAAGWTIKRSTERDRFNYKRRSMSLQLVYEIRSPRGDRTHIREPLELAHISDHDFRFLVSKSPLKIEQVYGDYDKRRLGKGSEMIYVLAWR